MGLETTASHCEKKVLVWLLAGDPAVRWQTLQDIVGADPVEVDRERSLMCREGWARRLLQYQDPQGQWGGGLYSPKWISTTYTMLLLRRLGFPPGPPEMEKGCRCLLDGGFFEDGGINYFKSLRHSETCVTGMVLSILAHFRFSDDRLPCLVEHLLRQQMEDGGWNCRSFQGARHSSFHTTISVLEGLREFEKLEAGFGRRLRSAQASGREFLLQHSLFRSDRTGRVIDSRMLRFSFPPRWYYDVLRALDYFREVGARRDDRLEEAIQLVCRRARGGRWLLQNRHPGRVFFELEEPGQPSRMNTLRALRVLRWWQGDASPR